MNPSVNPSEQQGQKRKSSKKDKNSNPEPQVAQAMDREQFHFVFGPMFAGDSELLDILYAAMEPDKKGGFVELRNFVNFSLVVARGSEHQQLEGSKLFKK